MRLKPVPLESQDVVSRTLSFEDNARCAVLFGRHHEHLALLERHLPVSLAARGNHQR
jgi:phosphate starvation-inducible protein PhoH and related proteins